MRQIYYQAAGGVVVHNGMVLVLDRPNRAEVRLPKGHIEKGESAAQAALREVREETGHIKLAIVADLGTQQVQFIDPYQGRHVVRDEHYFLMRSQVDVTVQREAAELQFRPMWLAFSVAVARLTFESEREFVRRAQGWIEENKASALLGL